MVPHTSLYNTSTRPELDELKELTRRTAVITEYKLIGYRRTNKLEVKMLILKIVSIHPANLALKKDGNFCQILYRQSLS